VSVRYHRRDEPFRRYSVGRNGRPGGGWRSPAANIGVDAAIFEAVRGSAPDLAGKGVANPLALLLAATMMIDHIDRSELAHQLRKAIHQTLNEDKVSTGDMGGTASTKELPGHRRRDRSLIVECLHKHP